MDINLISRIGRMISEGRLTQKEVAKECGISVSAVRRCVKQLPSVNPDLAYRVSIVVTYHKSIAHFRGGEATKLKHKGRTANESNE